MFLFDKCGTSVGKKDITVLFSVILLLLYISVSVFVSGCANSSVAPTGGAKDTLAPVLLKMTPSQKTTNFKGKELSFTFNEYVQIKDQKKFVISPPLPSKKPELKIKGKSVVVKLPSTADSTTYYLDFGTSVVDVNEGNPAKYLNFIFATGNDLDTMLYAGRIVDAFTLEPVNEANVFFYEDNKDSIVYQKNPSALSISNKDGVFIVKGLKNMKYKIVAIGDKNSNMRYDAGVETIAFSDSLIQSIILTDRDSVEFNSLPVFNMFSENVKKQGLVDYKRPEQRMIRLVFNEINAVINSFNIEKINPANIIRETGINGDTVTYWLSSREVQDTVFAELIYLKSDSLNRLSPDTARLKLLYSQPKRKSKDKDDEDEKIVPIEPSISDSPTDIAEKDLNISFKTPLLRAESSKISLSKIVEREGKEKEKVPVKFSFKRDSVYLRNYKLSADWEIASKYELTVLPEAFIDVYSIANDSIVKDFETADPEKFGKLTVEITNSDKQYILQLMNNKSVVYEKTVAGSKKTVFKYLKAGKYSIRLIEDENGNGKWDTGNYLDKKQPERVEFMTFSNGEDMIEIKSNWEHEQILDATEFFRKHSSQIQ
ncbi:MAG: Ig-like domain-containing protein [Prevotellaceae bacterium]|jgi:hypothetical protein|nr:Ig-like domain-containing protein [Prevotellaceae bacterium]